MFLYRLGAALSKRNSSEELKQGFEGLEGDKTATVLTNTAITKHGRELRCSGHDPLDHVL
ncbi:MAG: hypothetical protein A4E65_00761 [Syntrophorhabdus sp. PtaU1.Bin153]|nr:MAG: hypothetical protein A4E65_00761 [Syntrophorhabdus sp. PtaU1.Bin153]